MSKKAMDHVDARDLEAAELWRREAEEVAADEPAEVVGKRPPAKKDTRSWCKGKVGREHVLVIEIPPNAWRRKCGWIENVNPGPWYSCQHVEMCSRCGKQIRHSYGWLRDSGSATSLRPDECPAYTPRGTSAAEA